MIKSSKLATQPKIYKVIKSLVLAIALASVLVNLPSFNSPVSGGTIGKEELLIQGHHLHTLAILAGDPETILVGTHNGLFKSVDGGKTWEAVSGKVAKTDVMGLYAHQKSDQIVYASGHDIGIMKSADGRQSWISLVKGLPEHPDVHAMTSNPNDSNEVYVWIVEAGLFKSADGGKSWSLISPMLAHVNVFSLAVHPQKSDILYAGTSAGFLMTLDKGATWKVVKETPAEKPFYSLLIDPENPKTLFSGTKQALLKTTDEGLTWSSVEGIKESVMALAQHPMDPKKFYGLTAKGNLLKSQDGGGTWQ
jgi:photosystem II stability/assembly factor-like uncharacterized protein